MSSPQANPSVNSASESEHQAQPARMSGRGVSAQYSHMRPPHRAEMSKPNHLLGNDDEPMVYETQRDYAKWAREERDWLISMGANPDTIVLQSEVRNHVPKREGDSPAEYTKLYCDTMNDMIRRGVLILNDHSTADVVASGFGVAGGRYFNLGPGSGATKGEFKAFSQWYHEGGGAKGSVEVPERWLKFEEVRPNRD